MRILVVFAALAAAIPSFAASAPEALRRSGALLQDRLSATGFAAAAEESERDRSLRLTRKAADKAYRTAAELAMLERTAAELSGELDALERGAADQARRDRVERLLGFLTDALPPQADSLNWVAGILIHLKYEGPADTDAEFIAAIRALDERIVAADEAGKKVVAAIAANHGRDAALAAAGERARWLSGRLAEYAEDYAAYSDDVRKRSSALAGAYKPRS